MSKIKGKYIDYDPATLGVNGSGQLTALSIGGSPTPTVISANTTATKGNLYVLTGAAAITLTLPPTPTAGDQVSVTDLTGTRACVIARNGEKIMGLAEDLTLDKTSAGFTMEYTGATNGWGIF